MAHAETEKVLRRFEAEEQKSKVILAAQQESPPNLRLEEIQSEEDFRHSVQRKQKDRRRPPISAVRPGAGVGSAG